MIEAVAVLVGLALVGFSMYAAGQQGERDKASARLRANSNAVAYLQIFRITLRAQAQYGSAPPDRLERWADEIDAVLALAHEQARPLVPPDKPWGRS